MLLGNYTYTYNSYQRPMEAQSSIGDYTITQKIGEGSFGQIFEAVKEDVIYAIKTQSIDNIKPMIALQYQIFEELQKCKTTQRIGFGFPKVYTYKEEDHFSYMVMDRLDTTLQDLVNLELQNELQKDVMLVIMYNTLKCIRTLHEIGYLYRDVKPSNFMVKKSEMDEKKGKIYLIDLGLCKKYTKKDSNEHIPLKTKKKMIGTPIFCSVNSHLGIQCSRRDDLESWIYLIIYLVKKLPWEMHSAQSLPSQNGLNEAQTKQTTSDKIGKMKQSTNISLLVREQPKIPKCLLKIYEYIKHLEFQARPDYELIQKWMCQQYEKSTNSKQSLSNVYFNVKSMIKAQQAKEPKEKIKIAFKAPIVGNKIKKRKLQEINIVKILQN